MKKAPGAIPGPSLFIYACVMIGIYACVMIGLLADDDIARAGHVLLDGAIDLGDPDVAGAHHADLDLIGFALEGDVARAHHADLDGAAAAARDHDVARAGDVGLEITRDRLGADVAGPGDADLGGARRTRPGVARAGLADLKLPTGVGDRPIAAARVAEFDAVRAADVAKHRAASADAHVHRRPDGDLWNVLIGHFTDAAHPDRGLAVAAVAAVDPAHPQVAVDDDLVAFVADRQGQAGGGGQELHLNVRAVLRDDHDAGDRVLDLHGRLGLGDASGGNGGGQHGQGGHSAHRFAPHRMR